MRYTFNINLIYDRAIDSNDNDLKERNLVLRIHYNHRQK